MSAPEETSNWYLDFINNSVYGMLAIDALWGAYCTVVVFMRLSQKNFKSEALQDAFLTEMDASLTKGDLKAAVELSEGDNRAVPQLANLALANHHLPMEKIQEMLIERFNRDVIMDLENRINWINNVIKTAPMLGLLGTVLGMMAAFAKLAAGGKDGGVKPEALASDISFALITTAIGLAITIPATLSIAKINSSLKRLEDLVTSGLGRFLESLTNARKQSKMKGK